jgi:predicted RNA methylase
MLLRLQLWQKVRYGEIQVHYKSHLDGGGSSFGQNYIPLLNDCGMPRQPRIFEWCAGPGFIGFSLLALGMCETLCLADVNKTAIKACRRTIAANGLTDRVSVYHSDNLSNIPSTEQWDLVVGNPPHFDCAQFTELRFADRGWKVHQSFFASVGRFLKPRGIILIQENNMASTPETFIEMVEQGGLSIVCAPGAKSTRTPYTRFYYLAIMRRGQTPPKWLAAENPWWQRP